MFFVMLLSAYLMSVVVAFRYTGGAAIERANRAKMINAQSKHSTNCYMHSKFLDGRYARLGCRCGVENFSERVGYGNALAGAGLWPLLLGGKALRAGYGVYDRSPLSFFAEVEPPMSEKFAQKYAEAKQKQLEQENAEQAERIKSLEVDAGIRCRLCQSDECRDEICQNSTRRQGGALRNVRTRLTR